LAKGGGHAMAAGVTLRKDALGAFRAFLETELGAAVETARRDDAVLVDGALTARGATPELHATLAAAGPFGAGNPEPVIVLPGHAVAFADEVGQAHVRVRLQAGDGATIDAIAFRAAGQKLGEILLKNRGRSVHVAGTLGVDRWQGNERMQLRIVDVASADPVERMAP
jgi:single-stranded-DNA-specific exonuclease